MTEKTTDIILKPRQNTSITEQLRGIAKAPADFGYKKELARRYSE